ncbi:MAG TPA: right-handed parallel beta-helix repeat-containing protein, partial [Hanamia sp.]
QSGGQLTYTDPALASPTDGFGLFIQNDIRTLDTANEWYYNPKTGKIDIYSTSSPTNVQVATVQNLMVAASGVSYISVMNLSFIGSNSDALNFNNNGNNNNNHITVENCSISKAGIDGISAGGSYTNIENNTLTDINNTALNLCSSNASVINNTLKRVGLIPGMTQTNSVGSLCATGPNSLIQYNSIDSSGYIGIRFRGMNTIVKNNFLNHSCLIKDDGGGIYTWGTETGRQITGNIVLNSIGNSYGTNQPTNFLAHGIQLDGGTQFVTVSGNTFSGCRGAGIFVQQSTNIIINGNTAYNNGFPGNWMAGAIMFQYTASAPIRNITLKNNIFFAETLKQLALFYYTPSTNANDLLQFGTGDSNYYARPLDNNSIIFTQTGLGNKYYNLNTWKSYIGQDTHSNGSPKSITSPDSLLFEYNASTSSTKISLNANYIDVTGKSYNGTITLAPYTSAVLIKNGPATAAQSSWTASAGPNQTITLPVSTTTLTGSSSNASTYISSYVWTKISGPSGGVVTNYSLKTITLTGLVQGVYNYQVVITDNTGVSSTANVSVTVNAAQSSWTASAGPNQTITLPVSTTTLTGSSSNASTYISSYVWTKISGPSGGVVTNYSLKTITLTGLVQGVYNYQVVITDNTGVSSTANVSVTVNAALGSASNLGANASDSININYRADSILSVNSANPSLSLNGIQMSNLLKVYPNPVANVTTLEINIPIPNIDVMMTITDMNGSTVYKKKINSGYGLVSEQIDMSRFQEGVYVLSVILNGQIIKSLKVVKLAIN